MASRLGATAKAARQHAGLTLLDIATEAGVGQTTIHRFETGNRFRVETDRIVDAYAQLLDLPAEVLWRRALDRADP